MNVHKSCNWANVMSCSAFHNYEPKIAFTLYLILLLYSYIYLFFFCLHQHILVQNRYYPSSRYQCSLLPFKDHQGLLLEPLNLSSKGRGNKVCLHLMAVCMRTLLCLLTWRIKQGGCHQFFYSVRATIN